jgi:inhibitor of cysteine peptidase
MLRDFASMTSSAGEGVRYSVGAHGCGEEHGLSTFILTAGDNGATLDVRQGDEIVIQLPDNPTTGFRWAIDATRNDILQFRDAAFAPASSSGVGSGGIRAFTFIATAVGTVCLRLKLWREWEGDASIIDRFAVTIHIAR